MKLKLDENFDHRLVPAIRATLLSILPQLNTQPLAGRLWIVEPGRIRLYDPLNGP